jgi:isopropylmalate/homocitrate/citramalate synthase
MRASRAWAAAVGALTLEVADVIGDHIRSGAGNPDGIHYGWQGHHDVGMALAGSLAGALLGVAPSDQPSDQRDSRPAHR